MIAAASGPKLTHAVLHHQASQDLLVAAKKIIGETIDNVSADLRKISVDVSVSLLITMVYIIDIVAMI